jgi:hypothetical protein
VIVKRNRNAHNRTCRTRCIAGVDLLAASLASISTRSPLYVISSKVYSNGRNPACAVSNIEF